MSNSSSPLLFVELPLTLPSVANLREHWRPKAKRVAAQRAAVTMALKSREQRQAVLECQAALARGRLLEVQLTRIAPRAIRDTFDNLPVSLKAPVDALAALFGVDDSSDQLLFLKPRQEPGRAALRIEVVVQASGLEASEPTTSADAGAPLDRATLWLQMAGATCPAVRARAIAALTVIGEPGDVATLQALARRDLSPAGPFR